MLLEYPVVCHRPDCTNLAEFKIAAQWSDGTTHELKTYSLSCAACLPTLFPQSREKQKNCRRTAGETLGKPGVYERQNPRNPRQLARRPDLELG
jgi:hypothetical protein